MDDCTFCKIVKGDIPCHKIDENDNFLAFLSIRPISDGHTLIIPKAHFRWVYDVPNFSDYWQFAKDVSQKIKTKINPDYISFLTVGKDVPHAHIHIIPRFTNDLLTSILEDVDTTPSNEQLKSIADKINL